ncbi:tetratricopeptide repeat protein [Burkholderia guangdongensis]|uniref:tetratricopeptide repeat protein n=1 Tax=Burkholderia guangdongensis TaxID=1792500 RepID=UPI0015C84614|nr:tetratricopeptide repeat protein [Burkholderia guangdongensis]
MPIAAFCRIIFVALGLLTFNVQAGELPSSTSKPSLTMSDLPRNEKLPLFDPHRKSFTCVYQNQHVPPVDPQAELWFQRALALDNPDLYYQNRDYPKIYQLYVQAADHGHWKAMLNLASLILSDYPGVPQHDPEIAIRWVEKAMQLGVPDAYDMMGTYHQNGLIKGGDATSAYAFFQRAADMGSPSAMTFLGEKLDATYDDSDGEFWGNLPIATQMLECALAQGYGDAAEELGFVYARARTADAKRHALAVLQEGVKLGSAKCASKLSIEFDGFNLTNGRNLPGSIDKARADRYRVVKGALEHYQGRLKLPNLDKVLPLPPAPLPKWDGNAKTLIDAAKPVSQPAKSEKNSLQQGRSFVPDGHAVAALDRGVLTATGAQMVPKTGYWLALYGSSMQPDARLAARSGLPERYEAGERFEPSSYDWLPPDRVQWHYLGEAYRLPPQRADFLANLVGAGLLREIPSSPVALQCTGDRRCPESGIWESRVAEDHPMAVLYNRWDRQAFVEKGQAFPHAGDRFIDAAMTDVQWTYLGSPNAETGMPGIYAIGL